MFLNGILLWGTALCAVPVIIHLLNKQRFRPVQWAAMEFLINAIQKNARRVQIRDIIMLIIRTLAVLCLALALARPTVAGKGILGAGMKTGAVILLDNSLSMGYNNGRETRFDAAKRLAKQVISQLDRDSWCALYTFNDDVRAPLGDPTTNLDYLEQEIERSVLMSDGATNVEKALQKTKLLFDSHKEFQNANREIYVITDMQSRPWSTREVSTNFKPLLSELSQKAAVFVINAGDAASDNAALVDLTPTDTLATVDMPIAFVAKVKNFGQNDLKGVSVDVFINPTGKDDKPLQRLALDIPSGETASVTFEAKFPNGGDQRVEVRLADDRLMNDNRRFCVVEIIEESRVLLVDGREHSDDPQSNETGFLKFALSPVDPENPEKQSSVVTETVSAARMGDRNLLNYQAVVISNVARIPQPTIAVLERQVRAGMGLMIFLGDQTDEVFFNQQMGEGGAKLLPAKVGSLWGEDPIQQKQVPNYSFATDKLSHPIMSEFNNPDFGAEFLSAVKVHKGLDMDPLKDDNVRVVAWLNNGKPAIVEKKIGSGYVFMFAFPPTTAWGNLPTQPAFTILMLRSINMLTLGNRPAKNMPVTTPIHGVVSVADQNTNVRITPPPPLQKKETRPELTTDGRAAFDYNETERAGFYDIVLDRTPKVQMVYALNPNSEIESNLDVVLPASIKQNFPEFDFTFVAKSDDFQKALSAERRGTELWPWLIGAVFILLALESVLANRWAPRD